MTDHLADFQSVLKAAISEAKAAGVEPSTSQLEERAFAAYATSSEWLGEAGLAIKAFLAAPGSSLPLSVVEKLNFCLAEVRKVWPRI